jgi:hypothetical protein
MNLLLFTMLLPFQKSTELIINRDNFVCAHSDFFKDNSQADPILCTCIRTVDG